MRRRYITIAIGGGGTGRVIAIAKRGVWAVHRTSFITRQRCDFFSVTHCPSGIRVPYGGFTRREALALMRELPINYAPDVTREKMQAAERGVRSFKYGAAVRSVGLRHMNQAKMVRREC